MRSEDGSNWPTNGSTQDYGAGSKAKGIVAEVGFDEEAREECVEALDECIAIVENLSETQQRVVGFLLASDYTPEAIFAKADAKPGKPLTIGEEVNRRVNAFIAEHDAEGGEPLTANEVMALVTSATVAVRRKRKEQREKTAANKATTAA